MEIDNPNHVYFKIRSISSDLNKEDYAVKLKELKMIIDKYGNDARLILLMCLIDDIDTNNNLNAIKTGLLAQEIASLAPKSTFPVHMCQVIEGLKKPENNKLTEVFLRKLCEYLKLTISFSVLIAFGLALHPNHAVQEEGCKFLLRYLPEYTPPEPSLPEYALPPLLKLIATHKLFRDNPKTALKCIAALQAVHPGVKFYAAMAPSFEAAITFGSWVTAPTAISFHEILKRYGPNAATASTAVMSVEDLIKLFPVPLSPNSAAQVLVIVVHVIDVRNNAKVDGDGSENYAALSTLGIPLNADTNALLIDYTLENLVRCIASSSTNLVWTDVLLALDYPGFEVNAMCLKMIISTFNHMSNRSPFPFNVLFRAWTNITGQLSVVAGSLLLAKENFFSFKGAPGTATHLQGLTNLTNIQEPWSHVPLLEALFHIADSGQNALIMRVRNLLEAPVRECFEVFVMSLVDTKNSANLCRGDLLSTLIPLCIAPTAQNPQGNLPILTRLWSSHRDIVKNAVVQLYNVNPGMVPHIYSLGNNESLPDWNVELLGLGSSSPSFVIELSIARSSAVKEVHRLEDWFRAMIDKYGIEFAVALIQFLNRKIIIPASAAGLNPSFINGLSTELVAVLINVLQSLLVRPFPPSIEAERDMLHDNMLYLFLGSDKDVEQQAVAFFEAVYNQSLTMSDAMTSLKRLHNSAVEKERRLFFCMLKTLFDEYRFIVNYPDKELQIAAIFYGQLIMNDLVHSISLGVCLRQVFDGLLLPTSEGPAGRKFLFSLVSLRQFKAKLKDFPQYTKSVLQIPHLRTNYSELVNEIEKLSGLERTSEPVSGKSNSDTGVSKPLDASIVSSKAATSVSAPVAVLSKKTERLQVLLKVSKFDEEPAVPPVAVKDTVVMKINNLTDSNVESGTIEIKRILEPIFFPWLSNYLVIKRLSSQPNYHNVYIKMLDLISEKELNRAMYYATIDCIKKVLIQEKDHTTNERGALKSLGTWLGKITLAKSKPIFHRDLDIKDLLVASYEVGMLSSVVPFVAKILAACKDSTVFKPPNPWTMGMLAIVSEIYHAKVDGCGLKLNISFEIEILFQNLSPVPLETFESSSYLTSVSSPSMVNNNDFRTPDGPASSTPAEKPGVTNAGSKPAAANEAAATAGPGVATKVAAEIPKPTNSVPVTTGASSLFLRQINAGLVKDVVSAAVDHALRDCKAQIVDRYAEIACITTKMLILKDFAVEPDPVKMRSAAQMMVSTLSSGLVSVESSDLTLKMLMKHFDHFIKQPDFVSHVDAMKEAVVVLAQENLEICMILVKRWTVERALGLIDDVLSKAYVDRRAARDNGQMYIDTNILSKITNLPEVFFPKVGGLNVEQSRFYESFSRLKTPAGGPEDITVPASGTPGSPDVTSKVDRLNSLMISLVSSADAISNRLPGKKISAQSLPADSDIMLAIREIGNVAKSLVGVDITTGKAMQKFVTLVYQSLYELNTNALQVQLHCIVLRTLSDSIKGIPEYIMQLIYDDANEAKFNANLIVALVCSKLVVFPDFDKLLCGIIQRYNKDDAMVNFVVFILRQVMLVERVEVPTRFVLTLNLLAKMSPNDAIDRFIGDLTRAASVPGGASAAPTPTGVSTTAPGVSKPSGDMSTTTKSGKMQSNVVFTTVEFTPQTRMVIDHLLDAWITVCRKVEIGAEVPEKAWTQYLQLLSQRNIIQMEEHMDAFLRMTCIVVVDRTFQTVVEPPVIGGGEDVDTSSRIDYTLVKHFAKLISLLMKFAESMTTNQSNPMNNRLLMLSKAFVVVVKVIIEDHDAKVAAGVQWDQRPYFGFFDMFLKDTDLFPVGFESVAVSMSMLLLFSNTVLNALLPARVPGFAFGWVSLLSHRTFLAGMLRNRASSWSTMAQLLTNLLKFLDPMLRRATLNTSLKELNKGLLRLLTVILHDFPEFFVEYHAPLCDNLPLNCTQLKNLILCGKPRKLAYPEGHLTTEAELLQYPQFWEVPPACANAIAHLESTPLVVDIDNFLKHQVPSTFADDISEKVLLSGPVAAKVGSSCNIPLINAIVFYIVQKGVSANPKNTAEKAVAVNLLHSLCYSLGVEGSCVLLNAVANHLRYPNAHTMWCSNALLTMFLEARTPGLKEQIARVLMERMMTVPPNPWGIVFTMCELVRNGKYSFFSNSFTRCAPEIESFLKNVYNQASRVTSDTST